jgi:hypothetical protein
MNVKKILKYIIIFIISIVCLDRIILAIIRYKYKNSILARKKDKQKLYQETKNILDIIDRYNEIILEKY